MHHEETDMFALIIDAFRDLLHWVVAFSAVALLAAPLLAGLFLIGRYFLESAETRAARQKRQAKVDESGDPGDDTHGLADYWYARGGRKDRPTGPETAPPVNVDD
jgi:hypothetical protein